MVTTPAAKGFVQLLAQLKRGDSHCCFHIFGEQYFQSWRLQCLVEEVLDRVRRYQFQTSFGLN